MDKKLLAAYKLQSDESFCVLNGSPVSNLLGHWIFCSALGLVGPSVIISCFGDLYIQVDQTKRKPGLIIYLFFILRN
jgi:hypothetical protein